MSTDPTSGAGPEAGHEEAADGAGSLMDYANENPLATAALGLCVVAGAVSGYVLIEGDLSATRRILGGALAGAGSWLLVMVGRIIG
jgi:hypothetical protein